MPTVPKSTPKPATSLKAEFDAITAYLAQKPDFNKLITEVDIHPSKRGSATAYDDQIQRAVADSIGAAPSHAGVNELQQPDSVKDYKSSAQQAADKMVASADDHKAAPGPVMAQNLGEPASKEELKKRAEELNKK
ncbi:hypothetical protein LTR53_008630 [Teratosphaeriaceae sp. CCFEE 6253]|nr:hypothetical protein LTR53_008630 [Teratosphaeriaceae sp. CCFEE 6253]